MVILKPHTQFLKTSDVVVHNEHKMHPISYMDPLIAYHSYQKAG